MSEDLGKEVFRLTVTFECDGEKEGKALGLLAFFLIGKGKGNGVYDALSQGLLKVFVAVGGESGGCLLFSVFI